MPGRAAQAATIVWLPASCTSIRPSRKRGAILHPHILGEPQAQGRVRRRHGVRELAHNRPDITLEPVDAEVERGAPEQRLALRRV
jgi:hypothetical protein